MKAAGSPFQLFAVKTNSPPVIEGTVGDEEWGAASRVEEFIQYEPRRGEPSAVRTEAFVLYDDLNLYVGFRVYDDAAITAQLTQRDADLFADDAVVVLLDSSHDRQSAYYFMTNALATQADGRIGDDGKVRDTRWDAPWVSATRRTSYGWSAEMRIPLASINYAAGENVTWGLNLGRTRRRSLEVSFWAGPLENRDRVSQAGSLVGLNVPRPRDRFQMVPYGLSQLQQGESGSWKAGVDARYALNSQFAVYATVHPDFATIEADQETINLTRFEISLPEKRQFFLEGQELYQQRIQTFYSRRIADITAGGKLLGRAGPWTVAFIDAEAEAAADGRRSHYTVGRVQRALGRSYVATTVANRRQAGENQGSAALDANLFFSKTFGFTGQLIESYGPDGGSLGLLLRLAHDSPTSHSHLRYSHLGERLKDNANVIGFIPDDDRRELDAAALRKTFWLESGPVHRVAYDNNYNVYWSQFGQLRGWEVRQGVVTELRNRLSADASYVASFQRFEKDFHNHDLGFRLGYNTRAYQSVQAGFAVGRNFDSDFRLWTATARRKFSDQVSAEYELQRFTLEPDPEHRSTWIHVVRANQFFTKDLFLRAFFQTNSAIDRRNLQAVFVWRYQPPFGTVQLAFQRGTAEFGRQSDQGNTLFIKLTTVF
jgi:hypothetical protein